MAFNEYFEAEGQAFDLGKFDPGKIPDEVYSSARDTLVRACHDVFPRVRSSDGKEGIFLITRQNDPARGLIWPIGGGMRRGMSYQDSLKAVVRRECGLDITQITPLRNIGRFFWNTDPFGTGKGVDDIGLNFYAVGNGEIELDSLHSNPLIVSPADYLVLREDLHPYVQASLDEVFEQHW